MTEEAERKLTLDRPVTYRISVPGVFDKDWTDWAQGMVISCGGERHGHPITTLTGDLDQAALLGMLRRLSSLGLPLLSVICVDYEV